MKRYIVAVALVLAAWGAQAQTRKYIAHFPLFQQYYNPALTGYEGSVAKTFYRNQWGSIEGAPRTVFASAELDLDDLRSNGLQREQGLGARHALGLSVLHDRFGPFTESQVFLSYSSRVRLSEGLSLRWGTAATYSSQSLDGSRLTVDQENDPQYRDAMGQRSRNSKLDLNLGLTFTGEDFYVGYAMQDVVKGEILSGGDEFLQDMYTRKHVVQGGYRRAVTDELGLVAHAVYQYDARLESLVEGQLKGVYQNRLWLGAGYRHDLAFSASAGVRLNQLKVGYAYEVPTGEAGSIRLNTSEVTLTYNLFPARYTKDSGKVSIW
ncbi:PorP/SprF family type IX secretion system membrane protein [Pontibacter sp. MBLB2868]|uniref:PorP/SprF family type IX secretion system membrane protein n=1 Tax=Pontibacter sp. MBLB2868 TaxID=3451555 RepID=UPI003F74DD71